MKGVPFMNSAGLYVEIGQSSLKAIDGEDGLELSLERLENGRLTPLCAERLTLSLRVFLKKHNWRPHLRAFCALGARGVSLRRLTLPAGSKEELERLLPLQIEREFPLAPEDLAWDAATAAASTHRRPVRTTPPSRLVTTDARLTKQFPMSVAFVMGFSVLSSQDPGRRITDMDAAGDIIIVPTCHSFATVALERA